MCNTREANKKGSHIVPHFLLKRIENVDGKPGRDYELGFAIGEFDTESYFGRAVSPEKLKETFGELTEDELKVNKHPLIVDYYFCDVCEERFSKIESAYSKTITTFDKEKEYASGASSVIGLLLWMSVFWRMSIHQHSGTYLSDEENELMRSFLDRFLLTDISKIDQAMKDANGDAGKMSYKLVRCPNYSNDNVTHMSWHPAFRKAYSLLIDEFAVSLSITDDYSEFALNDFFGLNNEIDSSPRNQVSTQERIRPITVVKIQQAFVILVKQVASQRNKRMNEFWDELHVALGGKGSSMPSEIKNEILDELNSEEIRMGRKHTRKEIENCTIRVLMKYGPS